MSADPGEPAETWSRPLEAAWWIVRGRTLRTAGPVALAVGTILSAVNQGHLVAGGETDYATWLRVAVNYLVPFCVASIGYLAACRRAPDGTGG